MGENVAIVSDKITITPGNLLSHESFCSLNLPILYIPHDFVSFSIHDFDDIVIVLKQLKRKLKAKYP